MAGLSRLAQPCQTLTPGMLHRGHFHCEASGAGGDGDTDVEVEAAAVAAAVDAGEVPYGQERVAWLAAHHAHLSGAEQYREI